ncbi:MAG TPA: 2-oxoglutarate dehydrogenase E1 component, partial [Gammaproteobacteria bacterium]|nr:2-oxoglutarate dehydrogenase E1 component [Gammaproteobacteria bacterium]
MTEWFFTEFLNSKWFEYIFKLWMTVNKFESSVMQENTMEGYWASSALASGNAAYLENLYEEYLQDPQKLNFEMREYFNKFFEKKQDITKEVSPLKTSQYFQNLYKTSHVLESGRPHPSEEGARQKKLNQIYRLINAFRRYGHLAAKINPLTVSDRKPEVRKELSLAYYGLDRDLNRVFEVEIFGKKEIALAHLSQILQNTYCGTLGAEYMHLGSEEEKRWIQEKIETPNNLGVLNAVEQKQLLARLIAAEGLEHFLNIKYPGQIRFSLEGQESLIPLLEQIIQQSGIQGVQETVLAMSHRGRINVLVNILCKRPKDLFEDQGEKNDNHAASGDVKYHQGFSSNIKTPKKAMHLALAFNPSHLEIITPMAAGSVRARANRLSDPDFNRVLLIALHGDAAVAGQGVVMETMNMSQTRGFGIGGTIHVIVNNQVGFTTSRLEDLRSTHYCTDMFKGLLAPIFHVNADDPQMVIFVAKLALAYRMRFKKDVVIDLIGYRRHGHNEADEPAVTQPALYQEIKNHPPVPSLYAQNLSKLGVLSLEEADKIRQQNRQALEEGKCVAKNIVTLEADRCEEQDVVTSKLEQAIDWVPYFSHDWRQKVTTTLSKENIQTLGDKLVLVPEGFLLHPRVKKILEDRKTMFEGKKNLDWGCAETLAYAALLHAGYSVRLSGQDSSRSAFFYRHAVLYDQATPQITIPLKNIEKKPASFTVVDSLLSEEAVLAFEYGYATADPTTLVIWEAQFGDFANGAQIVIDQFISSGQQKWGRLCGMVMFLPH